MPESFTCASCGGTFPKGRSDEEALAESVARWGSIPPSEQEVVCDNCFKEIVDWLEEEEEDLE